ncbi:MAG: hypothetical protein MJ002_08855 [Paludibacteraceae bacterium]|nr:hypothetical protein [Paludibacteraceae bacterium]
MKKFFTFAVMVLACVASMTAQQCDEPITTDVPLDLSQRHGQVIGQGTYRHGSTACIEAIPDEGYVFAGWSDGSMENPRVFVVKYSLQSRFVKAPEKNDKIKENGLTIYSQHLTVFVSGSDDENYEIYSATGLKIYEGRDNSVVMPMSGIYFVKSSKGVTKILVNE